MTHRATIAVVPCILCGKTLGEHGMTNSTCSMFTTGPAHSLAGEAERAQDEISEVALLESLLNKRTKIIQRFMDAAKATDMETPDDVIARLAVSTPPVASAPFDVEKWYHSPEGFMVRYKANDPKLNFTHADREIALIKIAIAAALSPAQAAPQVIELPPREHFVIGEAAAPAAAPEPLIELMSKSHEPSASQAEGGQEGLIPLACQMAVLAHADQRDHCGKPGVLHVFHVGFSMTSATDMIVGLLHDSVEDANASLHSIRAIFGDEVADAVDAITHPKSEPYVDYLKRVMQNPIAHRVKIVDATHNLSRVDGIQDEKLRERLRKKFTNALEILAAHPVSSPEKGSK